MLVTLHFVLPHELIPKLNSSYFSGVVIMVILKLFYLVVIISIYDNHIVD